MSDGESTIFKFQIEMEDSCTITVPGFQRWLGVDMQNGVVCIWAQCKPSETDVRKKLYIRGTGHPMTGEEGTFVGMVQFSGLVFHFFEPSLLELLNETLQK